nr:right-handed parallel beta-helix repeat-containing protein [Candidatus Neomarinimicrobiota bacterium]
MKTFFTIISGLIILFSTVPLAQQSKKVNPYDGLVNSGTVYQPVIVVSPTAYSSTDYAIHPSSNNQSEMSIAISPADPNRLLVGANTTDSLASNKYLGYYYSSNGGTIWAGSDTLPGTTNLSWDPAVAFDTVGNAYFHYINKFNDIDSLVSYVKKSTDGGATWQNSVEIPGIGEPDKGHMAIDGNNIYVGLTDFSLYPIPVVFSRSTDSGSSFSEPINISGNVTSYFSMGVNLSIGPNGEVYAVWAIADDWVPGEFGSDGIGFNKSLDGGANWQTPSRIFNIDGSRDWWFDKNPDSTDAPIKMNDFPCIEVDRNGGEMDGTIYMVWGAKGQAPDRADIYFSKSTDGGSTWSTPVKVHNDNTSNDQWFPWISVNSHGVINIVFYDSRNDPNNQLTEAWVAQSADGGQTFTDFRVSDVAFTPYPIPGTAYGYMGDYLGITSKAGKAYASWMDNRTGTYQSYVDIVDNTVSGTITSNTIWSGYKLVTGNVTVNSGITLTISAGTLVFFKSGTHLTINGKILAQGASDAHIIFTSSNENPGPGDWGGIKITSSSSNNLQYCDISYAEDGISFQTTGTGSVTNCSIHNCSVGLELFRNENPQGLPPPHFTDNNIFLNNIGVHIFASEATLDSNSIRENNRGILVEQGLRYELIGNIINDNSTYGIYLVQSSNGFLDGNIIQRNGLSPEPGARVIGGIFLHSSSPVLINNTINSNLYHGITAMNGSQPVMNLNRSALNHIEGNGLSDPCSPPCEPESAELLLFDNSFPALAIGHNDIFDNQGGYLIYANPSSPSPLYVDITYNYWADEDPGLGERFYPDIFEYVPYDRDPNTGSDTSGAYFTNSQTLYQQGLTYEEEGNFTGAIQTYTTLISTFPDCIEAARSVPRLFVCTQQMGGNFQALQEYYDSLTAEYAETPLSKVADQYSVLTHLPVEEYATAIEKYETILSNPSSLEDSVYAVIDIGQVYLAAETNGQGGLGKRNTLGSKSEYRPIDRTDYEDKVNSALAILMGKGKSTKVTQIPESYALHQNYPNPFNPVTTIV